MRFPNWFTTNGTAQQAGRFASPSVRRIILGVWLAATVAATAVIALGFRIDNSVGVWFAQDDPALAEYRRFLDDFGHHEWMLVGLERTATAHATLIADRDRLVTALEGLEDVHWVLSASNLADDSYLVRKFLKPDPGSPYEALLLQVTNDIDSQEGYRETLVTRIRALAEPVPTVAGVHVAGTAVINGELNRAARHDMFLFFPAVAAFLALVGALLFRNVRDTAVLLSVSLSTVVITQGLLIGLGFPLNMITIMLPTVLIALSVADAVHLIHAFHGHRANGPDGAVAAARAVRAIAWPCAGTTLTTIAGFLAFSGSSVLPVLQLAVFASFGIALAWALTMVAAPVLLQVLWSGSDRVEPPAARATTRFLVTWSRFVSRCPRRIAATFAFGGLLLVGLASLRADTDYVKFFRSDSRVPRDYAALQRAGIPQNPLNLVFRVPPGETPLSARYWAPLGVFAAQLETLPGVHAVLSPFAMTGLSEAMGDRRRTLGGMSSRDGQQVQLIAMMDYPSSRRLFDLLPRIDALAENVLPAEMQLTPTGTSLQWARMDDGVIETQKESLAVVCVVCFVLLALLFRSAGLAVVGLVTSLLPVGLVLGLMGLLNIPVNMATVLIAGIAVGLAVDDTIHFVHAFRASRRQGVGRTDACERAVVDVGLRMVTTSAVLVGAFASMGLSRFMPTAQFGLLSSLTIALALAADLALLPVVLSWRGRASASQRDSGRVPAERIAPHPKLSGRPMWARSS